MMVGINWQYLVKGMKLLVAGFQLHVMHSWILCRIAPHQYAQHILGERSYLYFSMYYFRFHSNACQHVFRDRLDGSFPLTSTCALNNAGSYLVGTLFASL